MENQTASDLAKERKKCSFKPLDLTNLLDGGYQKTKENRAKVKALIDSNYESPIPIANLSHKEKYEEAIRRACVLYKTIRPFMPPDWHTWQDTNPKLSLFSLNSLLDSKYELLIPASTKVLVDLLNVLRLQSIFRDTVTVGHLMQDGNPFGVHMGMFLPTLLWQGTPEQHDKWLSRAWKFEIIGTYAQTELAHGTNVRALETTAVYEPSTQEFVINSPTFTSYKWWPGGLGHTANYAVVIAQLYTKGKCHGVHAFIVQVRDEDTHMPMPGIEIGEIGPKMGYNGTNNGYLAFKNVRIPRMQMLMKNSQVLSDGTYVPPKNPRLVYGTMIFVRVLIVIESATFLKHATTIATRYSAVRRQTNIQPNTPEVQVLDFVTQQYKIFPHIASAIAFHFVGDWLWKVYINLRLEMEKGQFDSLPEFHALSCVLKAITSADSSEGIEICRKACGGHGYLMSSGFPHLYGIAVPQITFEGENTVLYLQTARFLLKSWQNKERLVNSKTAKYLTNILDVNRPFEQSVEWIIYALKKTVAGAIDAASNHILKRVTNGDVLEEAANKSSLELVQAAELHGRAYIVEIFYNAVNEVNTSPELIIVLVQLMNLYAVDTLLKFSGLLFKYTSIRDIDTEVLQEWLEELLLAIRPNAVGIVDGFDVHDKVLGSALGAFDGKVYERLYEEAKKSPLNNEPVNKSFNLYLKDFMRSNLKSHL